MTCENCKFYLLEPRLCRRFPPKVISWKNPSPRSSDDELAGAWEQYEGVAVRYVANYDIRTDSISHRFDITHL